MNAQIGLIGGIGPAATDYYYRRIISKFSERNQPLELAMVHADTRMLLNNLERRDTESQVQIYQELSQRLVAAGAGLVAVTSIAGHFCISEFKEISPLSVVDLIETADQAVRIKGLKRVGILGTMAVMKSGFYNGLSSAEVVAPPEDMIANVHAGYVAMAAAGFVQDYQREIFDAACAWLVENARVDSVMLGGTDLTLVYQEATASFPILDCAAIHAEEIVSRAIGD